MTTCRTCQAAVLPEAKFCTHCGKPITVQKPKKKLGDDAGMRMLLPVGRSGWAIAAGYFGLFGLLILPAPLALICSVIAIWDITSHPEKHGMGRAIFGLIVGLFGTGILLLGLLRNL